MDLTPPQDRSPSPFHGSPQAPLLPSTSLERRHPSAPRWPPIPSQSEGLQSEGQRFPVLRSLTDSAERPGRAPAYAALPNVGAGYHHYMGHHLFSGNLPASALGHSPLGPRGEWHWEQACPASFLGEDFSEEFEEVYGMRFCTEKSDGTEESTCVSWAEMERHSRELDETNVKITLLDLVLEDPDIGTTSGNSGGSKTEDIEHRPKQAADLCKCCKMVPGCHLSPSQSKALSPNLGSHSPDTHIKGLFTLVDSPKPPRSPSVLEPAPRSDGGEAVQKAGGKIVPAAVRALRRSATKRHQSGVWCPPVIATSAVSSSCSSLQGSFKLSDLEEELGVKINMEEVKHKLEVKEEPMELAREGRSLSRLRVLPQKMSRLVQNMSGKCASVFAPRRRDAEIGDHAPTTPK